MPRVAVTPVPVMCPTVVGVPPTRPVTPVPRTMPRKPKIAPEPVVYYRSIDIYRLNDIVLAIYVLVNYYLNGYFVVFIFLHVY